jgi:hypothetical protein
MIFVMTLIPYLMSFVVGFLITSLTLKNDEHGSLLIKLLISQGVGMGASALITFLSFILFDRLIAPVTIFLHIILTAILLFYWRPRRGFFREGLSQFPRPSKMKIILHGLLWLCWLPLLYESSFYVHGGWDAWSVWNLKAKFLFLGGTSWDNLFHPSLWRSSPHYPLLLPLINVWGWTFTQAPVYYVPQCTAILFCLMTVYFLYASVKALTRSIVSFVPAFLVLTSPFFIKQAVSQYADIIFAFYLVAAGYCLIKAKIQNASSYAVMAGILLGLLSFTKGEGLLAAGLMTFLFSPYLLFKNPHQRKADILLTFLTSLGIACVPTLLFKVFLAPDNVTFTNGLISQTHPSTLGRLKTIFMFYLWELRDPKWHGLLILGGVAAIYKIRHLFNPRFILLTLFILLYTTAITAYYFVNTQFEIVWWLNCTLGRIIFAVLPLCLFLLFSALLSSDSKAIKKE